MMEPMPQTSSITMRICYWSRSWHWTRRRPTSCRAPLCVQVPLPHTHSHTVCLSLSLSRSLALSRARCLVSRSLARSLARSLSVSL